MGAHIARDQRRMMMAEGALEKGNRFAYTEAKFRKAFQTEGAESRTDG